MLVLIVTGIQIFLLDYILAFQVLALPKRAKLQQHIGRPTFELQPYGPGLFLNALGTL
jgi:hypothetical protein